MYVVKPEKGSRLHHTLHRDLLLPCGFLPVDKIVEQGPHSGIARQMNLRSSKVKTKQAECDDSERDLGDEEDEVYLFEQPPQFATWGSYVQEIERTPLRQPLNTLNPEAPVYSIQHSFMPKQINSDLSVKPP